MGEMGKGLSNYRNPCHAHSKTTGRPCGQPAVPGMNVCHWHGGKSQVGAGAHSFKHGRYSRYLPTRMIEQYEKSLRDPDLLSLKNDIAVVDARLAELVAMLDRGESGTHWRQLRAAMKRLNEVKTFEEKREALENLGHMIAQGGEVFKVWEDIFTAQDHRRRLAMTERRRLADMQASVTAEQAIALVHSVVALIRKHVTDRAILSALSEDVAALLHKQEPAAQLPGKEVVDVVAIS
jgi:hypothetical protein